MLVYIISIYYHNIYYSILDCKHIKLKRKILNRPAEIWNILPDSGIIFSNLKKNIIYNLKLPDLRKDLGPRDLF